MAYQANVEFKGHLFDSLLLPKVIDKALECKTECTIKEIIIGEGKSEKSYIRLKLTSDIKENLDKALEELKLMGGVQLEAYSKRVEIQGHIIDSLTLPKVMDIILNNNGRCIVEEIKIGVKQQEFSYARLNIIAKSQKELEEIILKVEKQGAQLV